MSGKRLLDAIALLNVAKSVTGQNLAIQRKHLEVLSKSSAVSRAVRQGLEATFRSVDSAAGNSKKNDEKPLIQPRTTTVKNQCASPEVGKQEQQQGPEAAISGHIEAIHNEEAAEDGRDVLGILSKGRRDLNLGQDVRHGGILARALDNLRSQDQSILEATTSVCLQAVSFCPNQNSYLDRLQERVKKVHLQMIYASIY